VSEAGLIWDPTHGYAVIFGGLGCGSVCGQTWAFSGGVWTQPHPATSPPARTYVDFAYDTAEGYGVQFGGQTYTGTNFGDTWAFT
jgi:hypothetical protein